MGSQTIRDDDDGTDAVAVMDDLRRIVQALRTSSRAAERKAGVSGAQLFVLQKLESGAAASLGELAARTSTHQSSVSVVVSKLVERGLVVRRPAKQDARRVELALSPTGKALLRRAPEAPQLQLLDALARLSKLDRRRLEQGLAALVAALGLSGEASPPLFFEDEPAPARPTATAARPPLPKGARMERGARRGAR